MAEQYLHGDRDQMGDAWVVPGPSVPATVEERLLEERRVSLCSWTEPKKANVPSQALSGPHLVG